MKQYYESQEKDSYRLDDMHIPKADGNRHYQQMLQELEDGTAEVIPYIVTVTVDDVKSTANNTVDQNYDEILLQEGAAFGLQGASEIKSLFFANLLSNEMMGNPPHNYNDDVVNTIIGITGESQEQFEQFLDSMRLWLHTNVADYYGQWRKKKDLLGGATTIEEVEAVDLIFVRCQL